MFIKYVYSHIMFNIFTSSISISTVDDLLDRVSNSESDVLCSWTTEAVGQLQAWPPLNEALLSLNHSWMHQKLSKQLGRRSINLAEDPLFSLSCFNEILFVFVGCCLISRQRSHVWKHGDIPSHRPLLDAHLDLSVKGLDSNNSEILQVQWIQRTNLDASKWHHLWALHPWHSQSQWTSGQRSSSLQCHGSMM